MNNKIENIPVPILPTIVGAITLSNVYGAMGFSFIRHLTMILASLIILAYIGKIVLYRERVVKEYSQTVPASLYAGFTMILMLLGSYYVAYSYSLGKGLWFLGLILHFLHILLFSYKNIIKERNINTFLPSWFVTFNGIMVSVVIGGAMKEPGLAKIITYYGIGIYFIILPLMIYRLLTVEIKKPVYHTQAILLAPCSLCLASYLTAIENPNRTLFYILLTAVLVFLAFVIWKLPRFFSLEFTPGYAGMTFPMAIGIVAVNMSIGFTEKIGNIGLSNFLNQVKGVQIYLTSFIIAYVLINFLIMFLGLREN